MQPTILSRDLPLYVPHPADVRKSHLGSDAEGYRIAYEFPGTEQEVETPTGHP
jgi:hypothetical protein